MSELTLPLKAALAPAGSAQGALDGIQLNPRELAATGYSVAPLWRDARVLVIAVAIGLAESQGYDRAHCDNFHDGPKGEKTLLSRDCGVWEINIPASSVGTKHEEALYDLRANAAAAYALFVRRGWQPWVSYNTGIYLHDTYLQRAALGVMNFLASYLVDQAQKRGTYQETPIPLISNKRLPYLQKKEQK